MTLRVVGAGLARTGTTSLKLALERLLGGRCYHMLEVFANPAHVSVWHDAARGQLPDWKEFLAGYRATVDLPAAAFWRELSAVDDDSLIILSVRATPQQWWDSMSHTVLSSLRPDPEPGTPLAGFRAMATEVWTSRIGGPFDGSAPAEMMRSYQEHNDTVRAEAPADRFLEWQATDGWAPLAAALGVPEPGEPFPRVNTRDQFGRPDLLQSLTGG